MPGIATCPKCGNTGRLSDSLLHKPIRCPQCNTRFTASATINRSATDTNAPPLAAPDGPMPARIGRFEVRRLLGTGAFGAVYQAYDPRLDRDVAIKVLRPGLLDNAKYVERFVREAKAAAGLRHPNIVPVHETGTDGGRHYIVSAYIAGRPLDDAIDDGGMAFGRAARIVRELAEALAYAHERGVVHRDVKPANVLLDEKDRPLLTDFGLASRVGVAEKLTNAGATVGTPAYMAPEQAQGHDGDAIPASDQYSLGVVLYELLTGRTPFAGRPEVVLYNQIHTPPDPPRKLRADVPPELEAVCLRAMAKDPGQRFATLDDLAAALVGKPPSADAAATPSVWETLPPPTKPAARPAKGSRRGRRWVVIGGVATVGLVLAAGLVVRSGELKAGQRLVPPLDLGGGMTMEFVYIPPGEFLMGAPDGEKGAEDDEKPQHRVRITKGFYLGKYEVTQEQYRAIMEANPSNFKEHNTNQDTRHFPVENLSWDEADRFCDKLTLKSGRRIILPTEAEWEYACRAGTTTPFHFGSVLDGTQANCDGSRPYGTEATGPSLKRTCKVGSYPANDWGLHDMHGNVWEWCRDAYDAKFYRNTSLHDDIFNSKGDTRVVRGGSYNDGGSGCRAADRFSIMPSGHWYFFGFRVLCRLD
ncbi:MAG: bifunctional serine/threonine-protein kinase/formylglycine-generating enzyme family protein [Gemmataceae bacterium]